ncbi:hypothetical protein EXIGLDRAFT_738169 [Exidia glandulosa HHB12029]|uniref:Formin GTPase-binding domain-containing protein n=1 Tax=Exidia glandulosa HHB12029 TaxID=1314781 RepID=A0A165Q022_EXIGL|nr:hypothetical protein EXIGLDRAFT_738169 [Exidia glandulosa HHB12029]
MFKGILPSSKRTASEAALEDDIFAPRAIGKENRPSDNHKAAGSKLGIAGGPGHKPRDDILLARRDRMLETVATNRAFERMLDDLQIPPTLRPKLATLESPVKAAMIRSSQFLTLSSATPVTTTLRRTRSTESLESPRKSLTEMFDKSGSPEPRSATGSSFSPAVHQAMSASGSAPESLTATHSRAISLDFPRSTSQPSVLSSKPGKLTKDKEKAGASAKPTTPEQFSQLLIHGSSITIDVEQVKKLRLYLRNEAAGWTEVFLLHGGYEALNARLTELLEVEWREEQHDDKCLHELLRCFKALSTSAGGCNALRSGVLQPYSPLMALLYSDKKPGELGTRQLIVELLLIVFELYQAPSSSPNPGSRAPSRIGPSSSAALPTEFSTLFALVREIILTPRPGPAEQPHVPVQPHDFIESLHVPRIYKTYLQELSDICRDYFWVFCHPNNTIWLLSHVDEARVEKPKAPGGMTGGVEYEAMQYLTTHFRLVNACALAALDLRVPAEHPHSAFKFHQDLQASGIERIIATARKASTAYYSTLHLEIARYVSLAARSGFEFSAGFMQLVGPPPAGMLKGASPATKQNASPSKMRAREAPKIPTPRKADAIVF